MSKTALLTSAVFLWLQLDDQVEILRSEGGRPGPFVADETPDHLLPMKQCLIHRQDSAADAAGCHDDGSHAVKPGV